MLKARKRIIGVLALLLVGIAAPAMFGVARAADAPPELPAYFTATNADAAKPTWPDPTGAASGVWATPAGGKRSRRERFRWPPRGNSPSARTKGLGSLNGDVQCA